MTSAHMTHPLQQCPPPHETASDIHEPRIHNPPFCYLVLIGRTILPFSLKEVCPLTEVVELPEMSPRHDQPDKLIVNTLFLSGQS